MTVSSERKSVILSISLFNAERESYNQLKLLYLIHNLINETINLKSLLEQECFFYTRFFSCFSRRLNCLKEMDNIELYRNAYKYKDGV